jgi:hypothetical protein
MTIKRNRVVSGFCWDLFEREERFDSKAIERIE